MQISDKIEYKINIDLEFDLGLLANGNVAADVRVFLVPLQKGVSADENFAQPLEDLGVVHDLVLDQLLRDGEEHLRAHVPEGVDGRLGVPHLDLVRVVQNQQRLHGLLRHVAHRRLVHQRHQPVDQLQGRALDFVTCLALILQTDFL